MDDKEELLFKMYRSLDVFELVEMGYCDLHAMILWNSSASNHKIERIFI